MLGYGYGYGSPFYMFWDPTYVLILIGVVLSLIASAMVRRNFARYSVVRSASGLTGAQVAQRILSYAGINDVTVCHISGNLTDHYNPRTKQIGLSDSVYGSNSVAAIAVAAHECGHVIQHANSYVPLSIRTVLVPVANFGSGVSWFFILAGILFSMPVLITAGIVFFSAAVLFQDTGILGTMETDGAKKVLRAAALTYVASAAAAILQLLRLILLFGRNNRD